MAKTNWAIANLRAFAILLVVSFHSVLAYLGSQPASQPPFDSPPFAWRAFPILDHEKWFGFDLYCALLYVFLMPLMFFISGLFVWPSLSRKGARAFAYNRSLRIGVPFVLGSAFLMPVAHYPVYRLAAIALRRIPIAGPVIFGERRVLVAEELHVASNNVLQDKLSKTARNLTASPFNPLKSSDVTAVGLPSSTYPESGPVLKR